VYQTPTHRNTLVRADTLSQLGQSQVGLQLDQSEHVRLDRLGHLAPDAISRLCNTRLLPRCGLLLAQLANILTTDAKALGENTATALAARIRFQNPHPQIVRIGSSHRRHRGHFTRESKNHPWNRYWVWLS
jgi:hypothetical protein